MSSRYESIRLDIWKSRQNLTYSIKVLEAVVEGVYKMLQVVSSWYEWTLFDLGKVESTD